MLKTLFGWIAALCALANISPAMASTRAAAESLTVGVIRWDAWFLESRHVKPLVAAPERLPFFALDAKGKTILPGGTGPTIAAENIYARAAGIDYWLFAYYAPTGSYGRDPATIDRLNRGLEAFRRQPDRSGMRFALALQQTYPATDFDRLVEMIAPVLADRDYLRLADGSRSLFVSDLGDWEKTLGTAAKVQAFFTRLRDTLAKRIGAKVRLTAMTARTTAAATYVGADRPFAAFSSYALAPPNDGRALSAEQCAAIGADFWGRALALGQPFIPNVTLGWDMSPRLAFPDLAAGGSTTPGSCRPGSQAQLTAQIAAARKAAIAGARGGHAPGILLYAWNELTEGGWLVPTRSEGTRRIAALARALGRENRLTREVTLSFPDDGDPRTPDDWPCPPGTRAAQDVAARPDEEMREIHAGRWTRRTCRLGG